MLSFKATGAVSDVIGSCYWLVAITWSLRPTIQTIIYVLGENSRARDYREPAQANFNSLTASLLKRTFGLHSANLLHTYYRWRNNFVAA